MKRTSTAELEARTDSKRSPEAKQAAIARKQQQKAQRLIRGK